MEQENYPLDDATIELLAEIKTAIDRQILVWQSQEQGALILFMKQQKLQGNWRVAANRRELERAPDPVPAQQ
jgi:hypothetical protein